MNLDEAREAVLQLAAGVSEERDPAGRLLEHVARAESPELSAALVELGAVAAVLEARKAERELLKGISGKHFPLIDQDGGKCARPVTRPGS